MNVFFALISSLSILRLDNFIIIFSQANSQYYRINANPKQNFESNFLHFSITFSDNYIHDWSQRWKSFWVDRKELTKLIGILQGLHSVKIFENGIIEITSNIEQNHVELNAVYRKLSEDIADSLQLSGNKIISISGNDEKIFFYAAGFDIQLVELFKKINSNLGHIITITESVFAPDLNPIILNAKNRFQPINGIITGDFSKWNKYLIQLRETFYRNANFVTTTKYMMLRIQRSNSSSILQNAIDNASMIESYLTKGSKITERLSKSYSDYINYFGIFITILGIAVGIFFAGFNVSETIRYITLIASATTIFAGIMSWINFNGKHSLVSELITLREFMSGNK